MKEGIYTNTLHDFCKKGRRRRNEEVNRLGDCFTLFNIVHNFNLFGVLVVDLSTGDATKARKRMIV
jgi:hypothetical protein